MTDEANTEALERPTTPVNTRGRSIGEMAKVLACSNLVREEFQGKEANVTLVLLGAEALEIPAFQALQGLVPIKGKLTMEAQLMRALCLRHAFICKYMREVESTSHRSIWETHRQGSPEPERFEFTIEEARKAGLLEKDNWKNYSADMLSARASARMCRRVYSDLLQGMVHTPEEISSTEETPLSSSPTAGAVGVADILGADEPETEAEDDVVDAEFEEVTDDEPAPEQVDTDEPSPPDLMTKAAARRIHDALGNARPAKQENFEAALEKRFGTRDLMQVPAAEETTVLKWLSR